MDEERTPVGAAADAVKSVAKAVVEKVGEKVTETVSGSPPEPPLPEDRASLLALHRQLRGRRDSLPLLGEERAETVIELARVEVQIARIERAMDPPRV
jgi:hypothetical protein